MMYKLISILFFVLFSFFLKAQRDTTNVVLLEKKATYYHDRFENRKTSSGERFSQKKYTAAHKTIKLGTLVKVTNKNNNKTVIVKINDRCPKKGIIDLSYIAAKRLGIIRSGYAKVTVEILPDYFYDLWQCQDSIFALFDKYNYSDSLQRLYQDSLMLVQKNGLSEQFLWTYHLRIALVETFEEVQKTLSKIPEQYKLYTRSLPVNIRNKDYYKVVIGPFMNEKEVQKLKEELEPIFKNVFIERSNAVNKK